MTRFEHPFGTMLRAVFKEMYPDKAPPDDTSINSVRIPADVLRETSKRYNESTERVIYTPFFVKKEDDSPKQGKEPTFRYV